MVEKGPKNLGNAPAPPKENFFLLEMFPNSSGPHFHDDACLESPN